MPARMRKYVVWSWHDADGPKYVGWGERVYQHPAKRIWARRNHFASDLNVWLRQHDREPRRVDYTSIVGFYRDEASLVASSHRDIFRRKGYQLLDSRPWGTKEGGGAARAVMGPDLEIYDSVRQAGMAEGVNPCTITRWCQTEGSGWDYLT